jgi:hypothetical protein
MVKHIVSKLYCRDDLLKIKQYACTVKAQKKAFIHSLAEIQKGDNDVPLVN